MSNIEEFKEQVFDEIRHIDEYGNEYWEGRELAVVLKYTEWRNFKKVIDKAIIACINSKNNIYYHFVEVNKTIKMPKGATKQITDYKLSRYACYLIVQNGDPRKKEIALGQTYFAVQTRKMELTQAEFDRLSEDEKRLYRRHQTRDGNKILYGIAKDKGVKNFDKFTNAGYRGLYNGETADDIAKRKGLRYREEILDNMGSAELGANVFRITQTEELLKKQNESNEAKANDIHYLVGKTIREAIKKLGGTMPEDLPTPEKSLKELEKDEMPKLPNKKYKKDWFKNNNLI